jgi:hypothetical protein
MTATRTDLERALREQSQFLEGVDLLESWQRYKKGRLRTQEMRALIDAYLAARRRFTEP